MLETCTNLWACLLETSRDSLVFGGDGARGRGEGRLEPRSLVAMEPALLINFNQLRMCF